MRPPLANRAGGCIGGWDMKRRNRTTYGRAWLVAGLLAVLLPLTLADARGSGVTPTHQWMDIYGSNSTFAGMPLPAGTYVAVFDPQGAQCGELVVQTPGALMPLAPNRVWGYLFHNAHRLGVPAALTALPSVSSVRPKPSMMISAVIGLNISRSFGGTRFTR